MIVSQKSLANLRSGGPGPYKARRPPADSLARLTWTQSQMIQQKDIGSNFASESSEKRPISCQKVQETQENTVDSENHAGSDNGQYVYQDESTS
jgi:hypothetical protein